MPRQPTFHHNLASLSTAIANEGIDITQRCEWWFRYLAPNPRASYRFMRAYPESTFAPKSRLQTNSGPETTDAQGHTTLSVYVSLVVTDDSITLQRAAQILSRMEPFTQEHALSFVGVACRPDRPPPPPLRKEWKSLEDAQWYRRHLDDIGHVAEITYLFAFTGPHLAAVDRAATALGMTTEIWEDDPEYDEYPVYPPLPPLLIASKNGDGSDEDLAHWFNQAQAIAASTRATFKGMDLADTDPDGDW